MSNADIRILFVEDDEIDRHALERFVRNERLPYHLHIETCRNEAIAVLQKKSFDLILLDYDLGTGTGLEVLPHTGNTPVIFITGSGTEEIAVEAIRQGARDYLVKDPDRNYLKVLPLTICTVLEREEGEQALRLFKRIVDAAEEHIAFLGRDFVLQAANRALLEAHHVAQGEVVGFGIADLQKKGWFNEIEDNKLKRCRAGVKVHHDQWFDYPGLGHRFMDVIYHPFFEKDGSISGILMVAHDITARKRAEDERLELEAHIQQVQKFESLNVMAGSIAHSFNNLLMGVLGNLELALTNLPQDSPSLRNIESAEIAAKRVAELSKLMLTYVGQAGGDSGTIDMSAMINDLSEILEASLSKDTTLELETADNETFFVADPTQVRQVIMNLVTNAAESMGNDPGTITITTGKRFCIRDDFKGPFQDQELPEGNYVFLEVKDTGCGMDEDTLSKAFDPFFTTRFTGRGMGLAAVLGIVRSSKGTVSLHSEPGTGSRATVLFPATAAVTTSGQEKKEDSTDWKGTGTVLLVDDEPMVREVGKEMLEELGFYVVTANDGIEALKAFQHYNHEIVCVLLDMTMPRMGGEETFRSLKQIDENLTVILCSGYTEEQVAERFMDNLPAPFIGKPFRLPQLAQKLRECLN